MCHTPLGHLNQLCHLCHRCVICVICQPQSATDTAEQARWDSHAAAAVCRYQSPTYLCCRPPAQVTGSQLASGGGRRGKGRGMRGKGRGGEAAVTVMTAAPPYFREECLAPAGPNWLNYIGGLAQTVKCHL